MVRLMACRNGSVRIAVDKPASSRRAASRCGRKKPLYCYYTLCLSMNAIAKQLGVSTPSILTWIRAHAATHAPRPQPEPGESVVVMELDELWHFLQKKPERQSLLGGGILSFQLAQISFR